MRKLAPVFIAASIFAVSSSAFALGDKRDNKQSPSTASTSSTATPSSYGSGTTSSGTMAGNGGMSAKPANATGASDSTTSGSSMGSAGAVSGTAATNGSSMAGSSPDKSTGARKTQAASNDATKCDVTRYASRSEMPKDCLDGKAGGAAVGSTQGQSGR